MCTSAGSTCGWRRSTSSAGCRSSKMRRIGVQGRRLAIRSRYPSHSTGSRTARSATL